MTSKIRNLRNGLFLLLFILISHVGFADMVFEPYLYEQGFEGNDPVQPWATDGTYTVNQIGITTNKAFAGTHSYVIDITINSGSYFYWGIPQPNVPCENILNLSGHIWVEQVVGTESVAKLGINALFPPTSYTGCDGYSPATYGAWNLINMDAVSYENNLANIVLNLYVWGATRDNVGAKINMIGIFIYGSAGNRIRVYLDDIKLAGTIPTAASYETEISSKWAPYVAKFNAQMDVFQSQQTNVQNRINSLPGNLSEFEQELKTEAQARLDYITVNYNYTSIINRGWLTPSEYNGINYGIDQASGIVDGIYMRRAGEITGIDHLLYNVEPTKTASRDILPEASYIPAYIKNKIYITAAPGEYESASFAVKAFSSLSAMTATVSNLVRSGSDNRTLASSNIDVRVVKCWQQNGIDTPDYYAGRKILVPELLLKNDSLIVMDGVDNYIKWSEGNYTWISDPTKLADMFCPTNTEFPIVDSSTLLPVDIASYPYPNNKYKQFWLTVNVPTGTAAGEYTGDITFTTPGAGEIGKYKITVNVLPFALENTSLKYSLYYRGILTTAGTGTISSENKSAEQFSNEMINMVNHGVKNPTVYQPYTSDLSLLNSVFALRTNAGMNETSLYYLGFGIGNSTDPVELAALKTKVTNVRNVAANYGVTDVYFYGTDEATGDNLLKQREAWEAVHEAGGKVFVAGYAGSLALQYPYGKCASWHFDETAGSMTYDSSENYTNHGTLMDMNTATCWVSGRIGGALAFDGVNDRVHVPSVSVLKYTGGEMTLDAWIYIDSTETTGGYLISKPWNGSGQYNYRLRIESNRKVTFALRGSTEFSITSTAIVPANGWHHIAATVTSGKLMTIYIDGASVKTGNHTIANWVPSSGDGNTALCIGSLFPYGTGWAGNAGFSFDGKIDEVRIYNRALRADEITKDYQAGINGKWTTVGDLKDLHVQASALSIDAANKTHEVIGHEIFSYYNPQCGAENPEIYRRNYGLSLWQYGYDGSMDYAYQHSAGFIWNDFDNSTYRDLNFTYPTINGVIDTIAWEGFREGVDDTRYMATLEKAIAEVPASTAKDDAIAFVNSLKNTVRLQYDDLAAIRNDIIGHILKLDGECASWHLDEGAGNIANDSSGNTNHGTLTDMNPPACWVSGRVSGALAFDGVNDRVHVPSVSALKYTGGEMTLEAWIYINPTETTGGYIISKPWNGNGQYNYQLQIGAWGEVAFLLGGSTEFLIVSPTVVPANGWHHIAATVTSGKLMTIYIDGASVKTGNHTITNWVPPSGDGNTALCIGSFFPYETGWAGNTGFSFDGKIDEVGIYNRALRADEITKHYQNGR